jgi:ABC-type spermidine/putrescine transport system permease subunit II
VALTPLVINVVTDEDSGSGVTGWDLGDAIDDAANLLAVSAGVAVIALAVAIPIGLMVLLALAINRAWLRRSRDRALRES